MARKRKKRNKKNEHFYSHLVSRTAVSWYLILFSIILMIVFLTGSHGTLHLIELEKQQIDLRTKQRTLIQQNAKLKAQIDSLENNPKAIEKIAREKYNMVKPGEDIYQVVPQK